MQGEGCGGLIWREQGDGEVRRREDLRKRQTKPTTTLFVVNFDVDRTRERDLEKHFEPYGRLKRVQIKRNYGAAGPPTHLVEGSPSSCPFTVVLAKFYSWLLLRISVWGARLG